MTASRLEPVRTCVGCRRTAERSSLLRVVLAGDGSFQPDPSGRAPGRGAYVHRGDACIDAAVRRGSLARALRARAQTATGATGPHEREAARLIEALRTAAGSSRGRAGTRSSAEEESGTVDDKDMDA